MYIVLIILGNVVFFAGLFCLIAAFRPSQFKVSRSVTMTASPERIFPHVNELRKWEAWNPWGRLDPNTQITYDGPPSGVGASYTWAGNMNVGEGRSTITESQLNQRILFRLEFMKPMQATNTAEFTFAPSGGQTVVTWTMSGKNNFLGKVFSLFVNCDKMIGGQFEKGLAAIKLLVETEGTGG